MAIIAGDNPNAVNAVWAAIPTSNSDLLAPPANQNLVDENGNEPGLPTTSAEQAPAATASGTQVNPTLGTTGGGGAINNPPAATNSTQVTDTAGTGTATPTANASSQNNSSSGGINSLGAKVGLGVGIPILLILIGVAIFFVVRRRKQRAREAGDTTEKMITPMDKQAAAGSILLSNSEHDQQHQSYGGPSDGSMVSAGSPYPGAGQAPLAPGLKHMAEDEIDRPVSPVQDDDLLQDRGERDVRSAASNQRGPTDRNVEDDGEMQWILEEERKQAERREQQGRLPTQR